MFGNKAQSELEYLMTYGWALIAIAIIIGILMFVTNGATSKVICQSQSNAIQVTDWSVTAGDLGVGITLRNATGGEITLVEAKGLGQFSGTGTVSSTTVEKNSKFTVMGVNAPSAGSSLSTSYIDVNYTIAGDLNASARIICSGTV